MKIILFVCVENAHRSQMAEAFLSKSANGHAVAASAGERPALKVDPKAIEVMKEIGIDTGKQRPKSLTMNMVEEADVVVTMDCGADVCPIVPKMVEEWKIEDPAGKFIEKFRYVRDELRKKAENLVEALEI